MKRHYPSGGANCWEISGKSWKGCTATFPLVLPVSLRGKYAAESEGAATGGSSNEKGPAWWLVFYPSLQITSSLLGLLILRLEGLQRRLAAVGVLLIIITLKGPKQSIEKWVLQLCKRPERRPWNNWRKLTIKVIYQTLMSNIHLL